MVYVTILAVFAQIVINQRALGYVSDSVFVPPYGYVSEEKAELIAAITDAINGVYHNEENLRRDDNDVLPENDTVEAIVPVIGTVPFSVPVKAKGTVSINGNFGCGSSPLQNVVKSSPSEVLSGAQNPITTPLTEITNTINDEGCDNDFASDDSTLENRIIEAIIPILGNMPFSAPVKAKGTVSLSGTFGRGTSPLQNLVKSKSLEPFPGKQHPTILPITMLPPIVLYRIAPTASTDSAVDSITSAHTLTDLHQDSVDSEIEATASALSPATVAPTDSDIDRIALEIDITASELIPIVPEVTSTPATISIILPGSSLYDETAENNFLVSGDLNTSGPIVVELIF